MNCKNSVGVFLCLIILLSYPTISHATIDIVHDLTIKLPDMTGHILQAKFNDVDGDGFPEVLVTDGDSIYLYSVSSSNYKLITPVDTAYWLGDILFDDVDRDSLPDIVFELWPKQNFEESILLRGFSSSDNYSMVRSASFGSLSSPFGIGVPPLFSAGLLAAVDSDGDGYNELLYSYDSIICSGCFLFLETYISIGNTFHFQSFPDSIWWSKNDVFVDISTVDANTDSSRTIVTSHSYSQYFGHGADWSVISSRLELFNVNGNINYLSTDQRDISCHSIGDDYSYKTLENLAAFGDIKLSNGSPELLVRVDWHDRCGTPSSNLFDSSGSRLDLYEFGSDDTLIHLWTRDITDYDISHFVFIPEFPGSFFAIYNNRVTQFMGNNGSVYQASGLIPDGKLSWEYPYGDNRLRLVVLDGDSISFYYLGIPTDADDANEFLLPQTFTLHDPYPNPFNPTSTITFVMPEGGRVKLEVFNIAGQRVAILFDGEAQAGETGVEWNAASLSSGVYFIRAYTENETHTVKALLLK